MEPESPRGRIAIMQAMASGEIAPSERARAHLDHCLACQACEAVCPAQVPYLQLLDAHRAAFPAPQGLRERLLQSLPLSRRGRPLLRLSLRLLAALRPALLRLSHACGLPRLGRWLSLAPQAVAWRRPPPPERPRVQVLTGCLGDLANGDTLQALSRCLDALGLPAEFLPGGLCCGALARHHGLTGRSAAARQALQARRRPELPLLALDSACALQLKGEDGGEELCRFLLGQDWTGIRLRPLETRVLLHSPCSHRNGLRDPLAARQLLQKIPGLVIETLDDPLCCGAAGTHMLDQPAAADALLAPKLAQLQDSPAPVLLTSNIGCALHFAAGLRRAGLRDGAQTPTVMHPVALLARQIDV